MKYLTLQPLEADLCYHDIPGLLPTIVYVHGLGSAGSSWFPPCIAHQGLRDHRSIIIDLLGYGFSDRPQDFTYDMDAHAETVASLLDHLQLKDCILVGHSMGGSIGILLAHLRPDLVGTLVVAEGNLDPGPGLVSRIITSFSEETFVREGCERFIRDMRSYGAKDYAHSLRAASPQAIHRSAVSLIANRTKTYRQCLLELSMPKAYVFGSETLPDPDETSLREAGIHVAIVPESGHDMMADNAHGFCETIRTVLEDLRIEPRQ